MNAYHVVIPEERYSLIEFFQDGLPGIGAINTALRDFEPRIVFAWHLSLMLCLDDVTENGLPTKAELAIINAYGRQLDSAIKGDEPGKPNALSIGKITWNHSRELIWRVFDPEIANGYLQSIISDITHESRRPFDFRIDHDPTWKMTEWYLAKHPAKSIEQNRLKEMNRFRFNYVDPE